MYNILTPLSCHLHEDASHYNKNRLHKINIMLTICIDEADEHLGLICLNQQQKTFCAVLN